MPSAGPSQTAPGFLPDEAERVLADVTAAYDSMADRLGPQALGKLGMGREREVDSVLTAYVVQQRLSGVPAAEVRTPRPSSIGNDLLDETPDMDVLGRFLPAEEVRRLVSELPTGTAVVVLTRPAGQNAYPEKGVNLVRGTGDGLYLVTQTNAGFQVRPFDRLDGDSFDVLLTGRRRRGVGHDALPAEDPGNPGYRADEAAAALNGIRSRLRPVQDQLRRLTSREASEETATFVWADAVDELYGGATTLEVVHDRPLGSPADYFPNKPGLELQRQDLEWQDVQAQLDRSEPDTRYILVEVKPGPDGRSALEAHSLSKGEDGAAYVVALTDGVPRLLPVSSLPRDSRYQMYRFRYDWGRGDVANRRNPLDVTDDEDDLWEAGTRSGADAAVKGDLPAAQPGEAGGPATPSREAAAAVPERNNFGKRTGGRAIEPSTGGPAAQSGADDRPVDLTGPAGGLSVQSDPGPAPAAGLPEAAAADAAVHLGDRPVDLAQYRWHGAYYGPADGDAAKIAADRAELARMIALIDPAVRFRSPHVGNCMSCTEVGIRLALGEEDAIAMDRGPLEIYEAVGARSW
jgi:hypothetical protein